MAIEDVESEHGLEALFKHIKNSWQYLGKTEPYWSVLTEDKYKQSNLQSSKEIFYDTGRHDVSRFLLTLARNGIDHTSYQSCLEYGCGLGRVTRWLAERFDVVYGYDISQAHLQGAKDYLSSKQITNVTLGHITNIKDILNLPQVDSVYSILVLQHNPPPIINLIVRQLIKALNPDGVAFFQVPTYRINYSFRLKKYLKEETKKQQMEMHVLSQKKIFEIVREEGGKLLEVLEDGLTGLGYKEISNTFVVQKE